MFGPAPQNLNPPTVWGLQWCNFPTPSSPSLSSFLFLFVGWCVCLAKRLSPLSPSSSPSLSPFLFRFIRWCVRLPEALFPFSLLVPQLVSQLVSLVSLVSELVPNLFLIPFVGWCACLLSYFPLLDDVSAFPKPCFLCPQACLPVCLPFFPFVGWCVRLPEALSPLFPSLSPSLSSSLFPFVFRYLVLRQS